MKKKEVIKLFFERGIYESRGSQNTITIKIGDLLRILDKLNLEDDAREELDLKISNLEDF